MGDVQPRFEPGAAITYTASAAVTGGRLVVPTGDRRVAHAGAAARNVVGVALRDAVAEAEAVVQKDGVFALRAVGAIAAGDEVIAAADGRVSTLAAAAGAVAADINNARAVVGVAQEAIADATDGDVLLQI